MKEAFTRKNLTTSSFRLVCLQKLSNLFFGFSNFFLWFCRFHGICSWICFISPPRFHYIQTISSHHLFFAVLLDDFEKSFFCSLIGICISSHLFVFKFVHVFQTYWGIKTQSKPWVKKFNLNVHALLYG